MPQSQQAVAAPVTIETEQGLLDTVLEQTPESPSRCPEGYTEVTVGVKRVRINKDALTDDDGEKQYILTVDDGRDEYYADVKFAGAVEFERVFIREQVFGCSSINCYGVRLVTSDPIYVKD